MSFLLDPPALVAIGVLLRRYVDQRDRRNRIAAGVVLVFIGVSTLLYLNILPWWWGEWISGTDWMLNSGLGTDLRRQPGTDILAIVMFAAYPLWMRFGLSIDTP